MGIDRYMQRKILTCLEAVFPRQVEFMEIASNVLTEDEMRDNSSCLNVLEYNIDYLVGHKLIHSELIKAPAIGLKSRYFFGITSNGIDFLEDDGGLSAILNTVTVKFDADNLRSLVEKGLLRADLPEDKKSSIRDALRSMPGNTLQAITSKLLEKAMDDPMGATRAVAGILGITL